MKITIKLASEKEVVFEPNETKSVSVEISEQGKIEIFSPGDSATHPGIAGPFIDVVEMNKPKQNHKDAIEALKIITDMNRIRNDIETYLHDVGLWGIGEGLKPNPKDFGIETKEA